jgi:uncharacterized repeat protein (TIGR02543 family)
MKRKAIVTGISSIVLVFVMGLAGCKPSVETKPEMYTVSFYANGGNGTEPASKIVEKGAAINLPGKGNLIGPNGQEFEGWKAGSTIYLAGDEYIVTGNITFTAQWKAANSGNTTIILQADGYGGQAATYEPESLLNGTKIVQGDEYTFTYSFKSNVFIDDLYISLVDCGEESNWDWRILSNSISIGENIAPNTVISGTVIITATGTATNATALANRLVFEARQTTIQPILTFTTLSLVKTGTQIPGATYSVTFESNGGSSVSSQTVNSGATATRPSNPTRANYTFDSWYSNSSLTTVYNFSSPVTSNITLYAKWTPVTVTNAATPVIGTHPRSASYSQGVTASALSVSATASDGGVLSYQWYWNSTVSVSGGTQVGTNSPSYTPSTAITGIRYYWVEVTNTNNSVNGVKTAKAISEMAGITIGTKTLSSIAVTSQPTQKTYGIGEPFNTGGLVVTATYSDSSTAPVSISASNLTYDFSSSGSKTITVSVEGKTTTITGITVQTLAQRVSAATSGATITLYGNENISSISLTKTITLRGSGAERKIGHTSTGNLFSLGNNGNLTLDSNVTMDGSGVSANSSNNLITVNGTNAFLTLKTGAKITGNKSTSGSAVSVTKGSFTMTGGTISDNTASSSGSSSQGAGVYVAGSGASFTMSGGTITSNSSGYGGGGVYVNSAALFTMSGGSITGNSASASSGRGGGLFLSGICDMSGGSISGNSAAYGTDVFVSCSNTNNSWGEFLISGAAQVGNIALYAYSLQYASFIRVGMFTGSVYSVDLQGNNTTMATVKNYWLTSNSNEVLRGEPGVTLNQSLVNKFPLGSFITSNGAKNSLSSYYINAEDGFLWEN